MFLGQSTLKTARAPSSSYPTILNNYKIHNSSYAGYPVYAAVHLCHPSGPWLSDCSPCF